MSIMTQTAAAKTKPVPQRTCAGCRLVTGKRDLVRIIRSPNGAVTVDLSAKGAGRGVYLCKNAKCWRAALRGKRLDQALRAVVSEDDRHTLAQYAGSLEAGR